MLASKVVVVGTMRECAKHLGGVLVTKLYQELKKLWYLPPWYFWCYHPFQICLLYDDTNVSVLKWLKITDLESSSCLVLLLKVGLSQFNWCKILYFVFSSFRQPKVCLLSKQSNFSWSYHFDLGQIFGCREEKKWSANFWHRSIKINLPLHKKEKEG